MQGEHVKRATENGREDDTLDLAECNDSDWLDFKSGLEN